MRRKLTPREKSDIMAERHAKESAAFPNLQIEVIVDDFTWANGEPNVRVISRGTKLDREVEPESRSSVVATPPNSKT